MASSLAIAVQRLEQAGDQLDRQAATRSGHWASPETPAKERNDEATRSLLEWLDAATSGLETYRAFLDANLGMRLESEEANSLLKLVLRMRRDSIKHVFSATGHLDQASPLVYEGAQPLKGRFEAAYRDLILVLEPFARTQQHFSTQPWAGSRDPVRIHESNAQLARESMAVSQTYAMFAEVTSSILEELRRVLTE